ncbi:MAG: tetratricopeptide repeat protein [Candidatus Latescibacteria bacterium]|nr:tetratricopeptide repeat protein [Candidatus Latescibacterota bacterium]
MAENLAKLERTLRRHPDSPLFARLAEGYLQRGMTNRALELCQRGCQAAPDYPTGYLILGQCYRAQGNFAAAREALQQALDLDPANPAGLALLADNFIDLDDPAAARTALQRAAGLDPFDRSLHQQLDQLTYKIRLEETQQPTPAPVPTTAIADPGEPEADNPIEPRPTSLSETLPPNRSSTTLDKALQSFEYRDEPEVDPANGNHPETAPITDLSVDQAPEPDQAQDEAAPLPPAPEAAPLAREPDPELVPVPMEITPAPQAEPVELAHGLPQPPTQDDTPAAPQADIVDEPSESQAVAVTPAEEPTVPPTADQLDSDQAVAFLSPQDDDELIRLFREIEQDQSAPETTPEPISLQATPPLDLSEQDSRIATATLAEIYSNQGLVQRAIETYRQMLEDHPDDEAVRQKLANLTQGETTSPQSK